MRTGYRVQAAAPGRSRNGARLGDEPPGPGLDQGSGGANAVPEVRQDAGGACGLRHITLKSEVRLHAPLPDFPRMGRFFDNGQTGNGAWR